MTSSLPAAQSGAQPLQRVPTDLKVPNGHCSHHPSRCGVHGSSLKPGPQILSALQTVHSAWFSELLKLFWTQLLHRRSLVGDCGLATALPGGHTVKFLHVVSAVLVPAVTCHARGWWFSPNLRKSYAFKPSYRSHCMHCGWGATCTCLD